MRLFEPHECVYLAEAKGDHGRVLKIGKTWNLRIRLRTLRREKKGSVALIARLPVASEDKALSLEKDLHNFARQGKYRGDWHPFRQEIVRKFLSMKGVIQWL